MVEGWRAEGAGGASGPRRSELPTLAQRRGLAVSVAAAVGIRGAAAMNSRRLSHKLSRGKVCRVVLRADPRASMTSRGSGGHEKSGLREAQPVTAAEARGKSRRTGPPSAGCAHTKAHITVLTFELGPPKSKRPLQKASSGSSEASVVHVGGVNRRRKARRLSKTCR